MQRPRQSAAFLTLGCKVNQYETDAMKEILIKNGWTIVDFSDPADVYIINTCSVTNVADRKSRQMIRRARRRNPDAVVVACGCYVQNKEENVLPEADILVGNNRKTEIADILNTYYQENRPKASCYVEDMMKEHAYENLSLTTCEGHTRAYLKIQDGCDQFCSYCIIPYVRGRIRSRAPEEVVREVKNLAASGFKEIVLTGIHLSSYGKDLGNSSLSHIIGLIHDIDGIERIRLGSLEPGIITEEFVKKIAGYRKLCPHFHLSLQSGCDATLKRMNRHYTTKDYEEALRILRSFYDDPACTTDVIAGFVGETDQEFRDTVNFLEKIRLYEMHIFKYSVRMGTRAEKMEGHVSESVKKQRSDELIALAARLKKEYEQRTAGSIQRVLLEEELQIGDKLYLQGYTDRYVKTAVELNNNQAQLKKNTLVTVQIKGFVSENILEGKLIID